MGSLSTSKQMQNTLHTSCARWQERCIRGQHAAMQLQPRRPGAGQMRLPARTLRSLSAAYMPAAAAACPTSLFTAYYTCEACSSSGGSRQPRHCRRCSRCEASSLATVPVAEQADRTAAAAATYAGVSAAAHRQSLEVLEWPALCRQVACFCGTSMAAELLLAGQLPVGSSREESELLLQQTQEAVDLGLTVAGVFDLRPAIDAVESDVVLNAKQLEGVATSMEAAFRLKAALCTVKDQAQHQQQHQPTQQQRPGDQTQGPMQQQQQQWQRYQTPRLADLAAGIIDRQLGTLQAIRSCISDGSIKSEASPQLAAVRAARQANKQAARTLVTRIARQLHSQGAAEGREPMLLRGRYCVGVKAAQRGALSKGSVKLGASGTGATLYIEPAELLELNNKEALLAEQEQQQEMAVLQALSTLLAGHADAIRALLDAVTRLDLVAARAKHAGWLGAVRPAFIGITKSSSGGGGGGSGSDYSVQQGSRNIYGHSPAASSPAMPSVSTSHTVHLSGARHPLLMQPALPPLPHPPSADDASFASDFISPPLSAFATSNTGKTISDSKRNGVQQASTVLPKPLDLRVPAKAKVVAITGPNTGGKTVTLKTMGLLVLMAKAGLFVPAEQSHQQPSMIWFDQVLADIGDSQSLQQNLSTFSGHIKRLKLLLAAAGSQSLVLLDEVGSGTDPQEGAALARAVLDWLADKAHLTLATSHHAELKTAADEDSRYVNVSMEFDTLTLRPTYKLCWGSAGSSNALDIAQALGFDSRVLSEARILVRMQDGQREQQANKMEQIAENMEGQLAAARARLVMLVAQREQAEQQTQQCKDKMQQLVALRHQFRARAVWVDQEQAEMVLQVQQAAKGVRRNQAGVADVQAVIDYYRGKVTAAKPAAAGQGEDADQLKAGDAVIVPSLGQGLNRIPARVLKVSGDYVWVESGVGAVFIATTKRSSQGIKLHRSKVFRQDELQLPWQGLAGLSGYDDQQAARDQQLITGVGTMLTGREAADGQQQQQ